ncbi:MAG TPA: uroporphyrinogen-III synthase [Myxococcota bacterium]|nr:uroporphyrinogen-III synthase [Myxococcota bacterium]
MALSPGPAVVLTREPEDNRRLKEALAARGVPVREIPCLATRFIRPDRLPSEPPAAVTFSSRRGVRACRRLDLLNELIPAELNVIVGAVGPATASELAAAGITVDLLAEPPEGRELARLLVAKLTSGSRVTLVGGNLRAGGMDTILAQAGMNLEPVIVYENIEPDVPACQPFRVAGVFVASPSAARRLLEKNPWMNKNRFFTIGSTTSRQLAERGIESIDVLGAGFDNWLEALHQAYLQAVAEEKE